MKYGNMLSSEDKILVKICGNLKVFLPEDPSRKRQALDNFPRKLRTISSIERTAEAVSHCHPELQIPLPQ